MTRASETSTSNEQRRATAFNIQTVRLRQLSRVVITRAYLATRKKYKKNTRKRREKKRKMNGVEINTRAYVATRLLLRWDYLYAVTLKTKVFGDYNHARLEVSWITSTRGLLLRGYTGMPQPEVNVPEEERIYPEFLGKLLKKYLERLMKFSKATKAGVEKSESHTFS